MRIARLKPADTSACGPAGTYYHLINRISGQPGDLPFGDLEKEKLLRMIHRLCQLYVIQPLSCVAMGNHYHLIVHAPLLPPSQEEAIRRFQAYYGDKRPLTEKQTRELPEKLRDISQFIKAIQQPFTCWFNRTRPAQRRRGTLWQGRFKSVILEPQAVIHCIAYVELNPVRARIIGSRLFVMELAAASRDRLAPEHPERIDRHRLGQLLSASDTAFFSWRNLQKIPT
jgi:REP element-mobilizing transposase RayT